MAYYGFYTPMGFVGITLAVQSMGTKRLKNMACSKAVGSASNGSGAAIPFIRAGLTNLFKNLFNYWFKLLVAQLFTTILYQPLFNLLIFFYNLVPGQDLGVAIILLTVVIKLILYPFSRQTIRGQKSMQRLQPKIEALKKEYANDREKQAQEMIKLYKEEKVNPLSSCLPLLIQLPFLIAVYQVFIHGINSDSLNLLYPFISNPGQLHTVSLGIVDLAKASWILAVLAGAAQFFQNRMLSTKRPPKNMPGAKDENMMAIMNQQMLYVMPVLTVLIGIRLPSGLVLYWFVLTALTVLQQYWMFQRDGVSPPSQPVNQPTA